MSNPKPILFDDLPGVKERAAKLRQDLAAMRAKKAARVIDPSAPSADELEAMHAAQHAEFIDTQLMNA
jgi:hypothetical protein